MKDLEEQIIDILNKSQNEFKGINEANLDSAFHIEKLIEKKLRVMYFAGLEMNDFDESLLKIKLST